MKKNLLYAALFIVLFVIGFLIAKNSGSEKSTFKRTQILLGTVVEIQIRNSDEEKANDAISKAFAEIKRIDDLFTTYKSEGEVYKINHQKDSILFVDDEIFELMKISDSLWQISNGAFDVSLNKITNAWKFDSENPSMPEIDSLKIALENSGWQNVELLDSNKILRKKNVEFNFGAIAKGYAVDRAIEILKNENVNEALVNAGGEIKAIGNDWKIGVQHPRNPNSLLVKIKLNGKSVATSGDYEKYFEVNGIRYHHILNPENGFPAKGLQSVTVIAKNDTWADAVSTALFVLGENKGLKLIENLQNTEALLVDSTGKQIFSSGFKKFLIKD